MNKFLIHICSNFTKSLVNRNQILIFGLQMIELRRIFNTVIHLNFVNMGIEPIHLKSVDFLLNLNFIEKDESENWILSPIMIDTLNIEEIHLKSVEFLQNLNFVEKDESQNWILSPIMIETLNQLTAEKTEEEKAAEEKAKAEAAARKQVTMKKLSKRRADAQFSVDLELDSINSAISDVEKPSEVETPAQVEAPVEAEAPAQVETPPMVKAPPKVIPATSNKYRPPARSKGGDEFLDTLNFDLKESNIQSRIKSELQQEKAQPPKSRTEQKESNDVDDLFDDALGETMEDFLSDFEDAIVVEKKEGKPVLSGPLIDILKEQGYIKGDLSTEEELQNVPEYEVLRIIIKEHPIPLEGIEEKSEIGFLSLVISNLQADNLIMYTNDYRWTITNKVKENLLEFMSINMDETGADDMERLREKIHRETTYEHQFITTMYKLELVESYDRGLIEMMQIPEFATLKTIKDYGPINVEGINKAISRSFEITPVQIRQILTKLQEENHITMNSDDTWELTDQFVKHLVASM